jgi:hypothetical protein
MVIDHVGYIFFPDTQIFRWIGRISFPLFAYHAALATRYTSDIRAYQRRLFKFALISQIPYTLAFQDYTANVLFTLLFATLFIEHILQKKYGHVLAIILTSLLIPMDYGIYGILLAYIFYHFHKDSIRIFTFSLVLNIVFILIYPARQLFSLLGVLICFFPYHLIRVQLHKGFFYWFYPAHLLILWLIFIIVI